MALKTIPLTEAHIALLENRGVSPEIAARLGWQTCESRKGDWIAIPFFRKGKQVNTKYRRIEKLPDVQNFEQDKGGEQIFYNLEALEALEKLPADEQRLQTIVITEGEFDAAVALQCGHTAVSVPSGAPDRQIDDEDSAKFAFLKDFPKFAVALLAVDDDPAGHILRHELATRLGWHRCMWVQYPKNRRHPEKGNCKDLNEVFQNYGAKGVNVVLKDKARFMNQGGIFRMSEIPEQPDRRAYECGIGNVSDMIKLRMGDVSVFTGMTSMGKTLFVNAMACNMVRMYGWNVCFGSFELNPRDDHQRALRTYHLGKARLNAAGNEQWSANEIADADRWIDQNFSFIVPDRNSDDMINLKWVLARVRAVITQYHANLVVIDPWNEIDHDRPPGMTLTEYTGYAIKEFKRLAMQYMVHITIVAHPSKPEKGKDGEYGIPTLYDISDSAHWANKCDIGVIIHRQDGEDDRKGVLVRVAKVRHWNVIGKTGDKTLEYLPYRGEYIDFPDFVPKGKAKQDRTKTEFADKKKPATKDRPPSLYDK